MLQEICQISNEASEEPHRRGSAWQQARRDLERRVRLDALDFRHFAATQGLTCVEAAAWLGVSSRTLRQWEQDLARAGLDAPARGRPVHRSPRESRMAVLAWLREVGPGIGLPTLQSRFIQIPRAELEDLLRRYRCVWLKRNERVMHVLHWQRPGAVWAMDFAETPASIDGVYPYLFAVRDLASGHQLLWQPVIDTSSTVVRAALSVLFTVHGAPLVLKSDNGSAFRSERMEQLLGSWEVCSLFSPPGLPAYNGCCEAGIGSLKRRTAGVAQAHRGPWTSVDVEAARQQANRIARPWGVHGPVREQLWSQRQPVTGLERRAFRETVKCLQHEERRAEGIPEERILDHYDQAALDRKAIGRALVAHDLLLFTRRRIPSPIIRAKVAIIT